MVEGDTKTANKGRVRPRTSRDWLPARFESDGKGGKNLKEHGKSGRLHEEVCTRLQAKPLSGKENEATGRAGMGLIYYNGSPCVKPGGYSAV